MTRSPPSRRSRPRRPRPPRGAGRPRPRGSASTRASSTRLVTTRRPGVVRSAVRTTRPASSTTPASTLVPPMSTPTTTPSFTGHILAHGTRHGPIGSLPSHFEPSCVTDGQECSSIQRHPRPTPPTVTDGHLGEKGISCAGASRQGQTYRRRGASAVEFALVVIPLLMVIAGIVNFGFVFAQQLALDNAVRAGARARCRRHRQARRRPRRPNQSTNGIGCAVTSGTARHDQPRRRRVRRARAARSAPTSWCHGRGQPRSSSFPWPLPELVLAQTRDAHEPGGVPVRVPVNRCATSWARSPSWSRSWPSSSSASPRSPSTSALRTSATATCRRLPTRAHWPARRRSTECPGQLCTRSGPTRRRRTRRTRRPSPSRSRTTRTAAGPRQPPSSSVDTCDPQAQGACIVSFGNSGDHARALRRASSVGHDDRITTDARRQRPRWTWHPAPASRVRPLALCSATIGCTGSRGDFVPASTSPGDGRSPPPGATPSCPGNWWTLDCPGESTGADSEVGRHSPTRS